VWGRVVETVGTVMGQLINMYVRGCPNRISIQRGIFSRLSQCCVIFDNYPLLTIPAICVT
jgi:hypothetical protein